MENHLLLKLNVNAFKGCKKTSRVLDACSNTKTSSAQLDKVFCGIKLQNSIPPFTRLFQ